MASGKRLGAIQETTHKQPAKRKAGIAAMCAQSVALTSWNSTTDHLCKMGRKIG